MQMATTVLADRVLIGQEFVPRASAGLGITTPNNKIVLAGDIYVPGPADVWDYLEVQSGGSLIADRTQDTVLSFITAIVLPGGVWDDGTQASPMTPGHFTIVFRDVPIDLAVDPFQWSHGLLNFGARYQVGAAKDPWGMATTDLPAGATMVTLAAVPTNWSVGDSLLIPDTAPPVMPPGAVAGRSRRETPMTIAAISGEMITFSKPLDFEHDIITAPVVDFSLLTAAEIAAATALGLVDGTHATISYPLVFNLTRSQISIVNENPAGTRGHQSDIGQGVLFDIEYTETYALGRTTIGPIDSTIYPADQPMNLAMPWSPSSTPSHLGGNEIARYNQHHHHCGSVPTGIVRGNVNRGLSDIPGATKWGMSIHQTSDTTHQGNIYYDFPGAGLATEDGNEVRNLIDGNAALYCYNVNITNGGPTDADTDLRLLRPGCEGTGFWLHGVGNSITNNVSYGCFSSGIALFNQDNPAGMLYPSAPGAMPDTPFPLYGQMVPVVFSGNVTNGHAVRGLEIWAVTTFPNVNHIACHNLIRQIEPIISNNVSIHLINPMLIGANAVPGHLYPVGCHSGFGYVINFVIEGGLIAGNVTGIEGGGGGNPLLGMSITGTVMQNLFDIPTMPSAVLFDHVLHVPLGANPPQYVGFGDGRVWNGTDPLPEPGDSAWWPQMGSRLTVKNWQGTGVDKRLFYKQSLGSTAAWYSQGGDGVSQFNCPVVGLTMQASWDTYGLAWGGGVCPDAQAETLVGCINGLALDGLVTAFPPPRAIVTFPTPRTPAVVNSDGTVQICAILTGDPALASANLIMSLDGGAPVTHPIDETRGILVVNGPGTPGAHIVEVWRTDSMGMEIAASAFTQSYTVGGVTPPVTVPNLAGLSLAVASTTLFAAGLTVGAVVSPVDAVVSQSPAAGASVAPGTPVNLVLS